MSARIAIEFYHWKIWSAFTYLFEHIAGALHLSTGGVLWQNVRLDSFLDAALDATDLREGSYDRSWQFLYDFYHKGQVGES